MSGKSGCKKLLTIGLNNYILGNMQIMHSRVSSKFLKFWKLLWNRSQNFYFFRLFFKQNFVENRKIINRTSKCHLRQILIPLQNLNLKSWKPRKFKLSHFLRIWRLRILILDLESGKRLRLFLMTFKRLVNISSWDFLIFRDVQTKVLISAHFRFQRIIWISRFL